MLLGKVLVEIRALTSLGKVEEAEDLADAFHNFPSQIMANDEQWRKDNHWYSEGWSKKYFEEVCAIYIEPMETKHPDAKWGYSNEIKRLAQENGYV